MNIYDNKASALELVPGPKKKQDRYQSSGPEMSRNGTGTGPGPVTSPRPGPEMFFDYLPYNHE